MRFMVAILLLSAGTRATGEARNEKGSGSLKGTVKHSSVKKYPTLVFVEEMAGKEFMPPAKNPVMDQKGKTFLPSVLPILVGTTVDFVNSDDFEHNVFSPDGETYNLGNWGKGAARPYTFKRPGVYVQLCKVHPEMVAYIVVVKTPYFALADGEGKFQLSGVPAGTWKLKIWNEKLKPKQLEMGFEAKVEDGKDSEIEIKP